MKNIKKVIYTLLVIPVLFACSKDFLDTKQKGALNEDNFYTSIDSIKLAVNGTYASLNNLASGLNTMDVQYIVFGSITSDDAEAGGEVGGNDFQDIQDADRGTIVAAESKLLSDYFWAYNYKTILRANSTLNGIKNFRNASLSAENLKTLNQFEGEMDFILAFIHFKLVQVYGGVPIVDHILSSSEYNVKRDSISRCLHFVEGLLTKASTLLPLRSQYPLTELGRATKGSAQGLLARVYLYEASYAKNYPGDARFSGCTNTYSKALKYADSVINSHEYELVGINGETFDTYWNQKNSKIYPALTPGYRYIFSADGRNSKEAVFETQANNDRQDYMLTRGTYLTVYMTCRNTSKGTLGWGFNCPSDSLLNAYTPGDPRIKVSIGKTGDSVYLTTGWATLDCQQSPTNMIGRKFEASPAQYWNNKTTDGNGPNNFPYLRYADVILIAAEAEIETGQNISSGETPADLINMIRKRARNGAATGVPVDFTGTATLQDVIKERRLELAMEGQRFFDLVRWKMQDRLTGIPLMNFRSGVRQTSPISCSFTSGKNDFIPIPQQEVINSNNNLVQYPGW